MTVLCSVKLTANFERNLEEIDGFLREAEEPQAFNALLEDLTECVIPNLERFPDMGRNFSSRSTRSVEVGSALERLERTLSAIGKGGKLREYILPHYLLLYAHFGSTIYLLSIRHHRQLSFDFASLWADL